MRCGRHGCARHSAVCLRGRDGRSGSAAMLLLLLLLLLLLRRCCLRLRQKIGDETLLRGVVGGQLLARGERIRRVLRAPDAHQREALAEKHHALCLPIGVLLRELQRAVVVRQCCAVLSQLGVHGGARAREAAGERVRRARGCVGRG